MSFSMIDGLLHAIVAFHPEYATIIDQAIKHEPQLEALVPVVTAAIAEGGSALAAAEKAAPDLTKAIKDFASSLPSVAATQQEADAKVSKHSENITRMLTGHSVMTADEEKAWMDSTTSSVGLGSG